MKRTIANILGATIAVVAVAPTALAAEVAVTSQVRLTGVAYTPQTLVGAAYNGRLAGISSFGDLEADVLLNDVAAEDLIEAAIAQGRLTQAHLEDRGFTNAVEANLRDLVSGD